MSPGRVVVGLGLVATGVLFVLDSAGALDAGDTIGNWWPLLLVALGIFQLVTDPRTWLGSGILVAVGVVLLGTHQDWLHGSAWSLLFAAILIVVGLRLLNVSRRGGTVVTGPAPAPAHGETATVDAVAVLSKRRVTVTSPAFLGGDITSVLGSLDLDLTGATLGPGARLNATVVLGGLNVLVPQGWRVELTGTPILIGWDNTTRRDVIGPDAPVLQISAVTVLGGLEVRHPERWS
jgi:hypothetical protein